MIAWPLAARTILPAAALCLALATTAYAQGTDAQREACTPDAVKLCSDTIPDIPKTTACMKAHEAALSPRCRAVFDEPTTREAAAESRKAHARRAALAREERDSPVELRHDRAATVPYADPLGGSRVDEVGDAPRPVPPDAPAYADDGPDIRHFPPGEGPDEIGPPPIYDGRDDVEPRSLGPRAEDGPRAWDGPRFADRDGPDGYDGPSGPQHGGPPDFDGPPGRDDSGPGVASDRWRRHGGHPARVVIARMCARGEIDPRTCSETMRALERRHE